MHCFMHNEGERMNILLTSVGRRSYLVQYFKEALGIDGEVHVANSSNISPAFQFADKAIVTPLIYDIDYIPFLVNYCKENEIKAVLSLLDIDLPILAKNREKFETVGTKLLIADNAVLDICNDKWNTYNFLVRNGFATPKTYVSLKTAEQAIEEGELNLPVIVKPRWGLGSISIFEAETVEELRVFYEKVKRENMRTYLKYESAENLDESILIQEKLNGQEHGMDVINDLNGKYMNTIIKKKYAMRSGETDCAITIENSDMQALGQQLSEKFKHVANLDVDVFLCEGVPYVLEMNARFGGGYPFSHMAGVNLPLAIVKWLKGEEVGAELLKAKPDTISQKDINLVRLTL